MKASSSSDTVSSSAFTPLGIMQVVLAVFFAVTGILFLMNYNSSGAQFGRALGQLFGKGPDVLKFVTAIIELVAGAVLLIGFFGIIPRRTMFLAALVILVLWGVQLALSHFLNGFLKPDVLPWLQSFSLDAIILIALWGCTSRYA